MKKKKTGLYWGIGLLCLFLLGCAKKGMIVETDEVVIESGVDESKADSVVHEDGDDDSGREAVWEEAALEEAADTALADRTEDVEEEPTLWVHISGEVIRPGVYELKAGARIWEAIQAAGGVTEEGAGDYLNQAQPLADGMKVTVPSFAQIEEWETQGDQKALAELIVPAQSSGGETAARQEADSRIDINTADEAALCTLPGIGESRARSIIAYRQENGGFARIEDIMKVSGIKEAAFNKIKDRIKVSGE